MYIFYFYLYIFIINLSVKIYINYELYIMKNVKKMLRSKEKEYNTHALLTYTFC